MMESSMDEPKSKAQKKRDADSLQKIGVELISLSQAKLETLPLTPQLRLAIMEARRLKSHGAIRRQQQLIGKLMRAGNTEEILEEYGKMQAEASAQTADFHLMEVWRARLIAEGKDALTEFISTYQPADVQQLRQLIKKAVDESLKEQSTGASKALFRFLRSCLT